MRCGVKKWLFGLIWCSQIYASVSESSSPPDQTTAVSVTPTVSRNILATTSLLKDGTTQIGNSYFESQVITPTVNTPGTPQQNLLTSEIQIGNSFFESSTKVVERISQIGLSYEDRINMSDIFVYYNQLLSNNLFYEIRAYAGYNYLVTNPNLPQLPISNQNNPPGYGFVGILGYVIPLNNNVTLMPFIRLSYYNNFAVVYSNSNGNSINSNQYIAQGGARLSLDINKIFAIYASYWAGYQVTYLSGGGAFANSNDPQLSGLASTLEFGLPYKMTKRLSFIPYTQYNVSANSPNNSASTTPYNAITATNTNILYGIKIGYDL